MRSAIATLALALIPASALAAKLPLEDGDYTRGQCNAGSSDYIESFDIQTFREGPQKGSRLLYPEAEGQEGACVTGNISASGADFSGRRNAQAADHEFNIVLEPIDFR